MGAHRFYYGKPKTGTLYFFTLGLLFVGWIIDLFLMPKLESEADRHYTEGRFSYSVAWVLLSVFGLFGFHRMYMKKWITGLLYFFTGGLFVVGYLYDLWTLNDQVDELNRNPI